MKRDHKLTGSVIFYGYGLNDPPTRQAAESLNQLGHAVTLFQTSPSRSDIPYSSPPFTVINSSKIHQSFIPNGIRSVLNWSVFNLQLRAHLRKTKPDFLVTIMVHALASVPPGYPTAGRSLTSCIYDIHPLEYAGRLDRHIARHGWNRIKHANTVWSSDPHKAELTRRSGTLSQTPIVCYNCPKRDYLPDSAIERHPWLRQKLIEDGASIGQTGGSLLIRTGALGEGSCVFETLEAMQALPNDYIFVILGRSNETFQQELRTRIRQFGLVRRVFLFDRPNDVVWKLALQGADIGHLIHGHFTSPNLRRLFELNSSLSNNRLFQYMAAALPILSYDDPRMDVIHRDVACFRVAESSRLAGSIQSAWKELAGSASLRASLGAAGRRAHLDKYCWEEQFAPVIERILNRPEPRRQS
jgi:hypothetical protein